MFHAFTPQPQSVTALWTVFIFRPTEGRRLSLSVSRSVGLSVTIESPAKTAEPIEMPVVLWIQVDRRNHVLVGIPMRKGNFEGGGKGRPIVKYKDYMS